MLWDILYILLGLVVGLVIGFLVARKLMKNELKKNPPINEQMIKAMMSGMGRTPSQKQPQAHSKYVPKCCVFSGIYQIPTVQQSERLHGTVPMQQNSNWLHAKILLGTRR